MIVAIAGSGDMARYASEELVRDGHEVVILSRSEKPYFGLPGVQQMLTDYEVPALVEALDRCKAQSLVSMILDNSSAFIKVHEKMIFACQRSSTCKRFIPSEYGGNIEDFPEQPGFYYRTREPIRKILRGQTQLEWTLLCCGWLVDYILPLKNRHLKDIGEAFPVDLAAGRIIIPGTGDEQVTFVSARDLVRALSALLRAPSWKEYTYVSGERSTFNQLAQVMTAREPSLRVFHKSEAKLKEIMSSTKNKDEVILAEFQKATVDGALYLPSDRVQADRQKFLPNVHFRGVQDLLSEADNNPNVVL